MSSAGRSNRLGRLWLPRLSGQGDRELLAGADVELREHLVQVPFDGARAEEELRTDLRVRLTVPGELRDLCLLGGELVARVVGASARFLSGGDELSPRSLGESLHAHGAEHVVRRVQVLARVDAPVLSSQPLAVEKMRAGLVGREAAAAEPVDRLAVERVGCRALAEQRARAGLDAERQLGAGRLRPLGQTLERRGCRLASA